MNKNEINPNAPVKKKRMQIMALGGPDFFSGINGGSIVLNK